jgi:hypothetical protein
MYRFDKLREAAAGDWACSPEKAKEELGFCPHTPLMDRLRQTAKWYRELGGLCGAGGSYARRTALPGRRDSLERLSCVFLIRAGHEDSPGNR